MQSQTWKAFTLMHPPVYSSHRHIPKEYMSAATVNSEDPFTISGANHIGFVGLHEETAFCKFAGVSLDKLKSPTQADTKSFSTNMLGVLRSLHHANNSPSVTQKLKRNDVEGLTSSTIKQSASLIKVKTEFYLSQRLVPASPMQDGDFLRIQKVHSTGNSNRNI